MATIPDDNESEQQPTVERVARAVVAPIERTPRSLTLLVIAAGAGSYAPDVFGALVVMACVAVSWDLARKR